MSCLTTSLIMVPSPKTRRFGSVLPQIIAGLDYRHQLNIYHRDLKLENILLVACRAVKLADFGLAAPQPTGHWFNTLCGSPNYVPPELIHERKYRGDKADIWSCGVILYTLLTGYLPVHWWLSSVSARSTSNPMKWFMLWGLLLHTEC